MKDNFINKLTRIIGIQARLFEKADEKKFAHKPSPEKWSKKEILGHLIDSAQNNIQRFIRTQYEESPSIAYNQDYWVKLNNYQHVELAKLSSLWQLLNEQIIVILGNMDPDDLNRPCPVNNESHTLEWVVEDYIRHLDHHLEQINGDI